MTTAHSIPTAQNLDLRVRDLGRMNYADALALQRTLQAEVIESRAGKAADGTAGTTGLAHLLLVEHDPPVITVSRRPGARQHLLATDAMLASAGVEVCETDRGGDITYHGPGQLVVYPILDLNRFGLRIDSYMRLIEQVVIDVLAQFTIVGERDARATGVWVRSSGADAHGLQSVGVERQTCSQSSKICAMGVRVSRWVTMHGLALNVTTNLTHFNLIVPNPFLIASWCDPEKAV
jgi:lipoyl(octanoyl) transferase